MTKKVCSECDHEKDLSEFSPHPRGRLGVQGYCKVCGAERAQWYRINAKTDFQLRNRHIYLTKEIGRVEREMKARGLTP